MRRLFFTATLLIISAIFLLVWDSPPKAFLNPSQPNIQQELSQADGYMLNTETVRYNHDGSRNYTITTTESRYYKRAGTFELDNPDMTIFNNEDPLHPWFLKSKQGEVFSEEQRVVLTKDVHAWQAKNVDDRNELQTQRLVLFPDKQVAESDKKVIITTPRGRTTGIGMWANLDQERFKLLDNVKGIHSAQP